MCTSLLIFDCDFHSGRSPDLPSLGRVLLVLDLLGGATFSSSRRSDCRPLFPRFNTLNQIKPKYFKI